MTSETDKIQGRRSFKTMVGNIMYIGNNFLPMFMFFIYYKAITGSILCIILSLAQLIGQAFVTKQSWYDKFLAFFELEKYFDEYTLEFEEKIDEQQSLICVHPHNVFTLGFTFNCYANRFGNILVCASRMLLDSPLLGLFHKLAGATSVDPANMKNLMSKKQNLGLFPGGFEEATLTTHKENRVFILQRKGFIKYALRYGYKIYPVFIFGENQIYQTIERFETFRLLLNKLKLVGVIFWSRLGFLPECHSKINTVCGKGIVLPHILEPSDQDVEKYHAIYVETLKDLYNRNKVKYGETSELKVF